MEKHFLTQQEDQLFEQWKNNESVARLPPEAYNPPRTDKGFICDGLFDPAEYLRSKVRIIFVLKDTYSDASNEEWDLRKLCRDENCKKAAWTTISRWVYHLHNPSLSYDDSEKNWDMLNNQVEKNKRSEILQSIGVMNVKKKTADQHSTTNHKHLAEWGNDCANLSFLKKQWEIYKPNITICGGGHGRILFNTLLKALDGENTRDTLETHGHEYWKSDKSKQLIISSLHPAARHKKAKDKHFGLMQAIHEVFSEELKELLSR